MPRQSQLTNVFQTSIYHSAGSRPLQKARESPSSSTTSALSSTLTRRSHKYPKAQHHVNGLKFDVDFNHIYQRNRHLLAHQLGHRVKYKTHLAGRRECSSIWQYGFELEYNRPQTSRTSRLWLCKTCHEEKRNNYALLVNATAYTVSHIVKRHHINPSTDLIPDGRSTPADLWMAAKVAGALNHIAHTPWERININRPLLIVQYSTIYCSTRQGQQPPEAC